MATRPTSLPRWAETAGGTPSANIAEPTSAKKDVGWVNSEKPPAGILDWLQNTVYRWIKYLDESGSDQLFGDGSDGAAVFNGSGAVTGASGTGPYTLTRDVFYTDVTFSANVTLNKAGFRMWWNGTLDASAANVTIACDGGNGGTGISGGAAGTRPGASGVLGAQSGGAGSAGTGGGASTAQTVTAALGSAGGAGGTGASGTPAGASTRTAPTAAEGNLHVPSTLATGLLLGASGAVPVQGGAGGTGGTGSGAGTSGGGGGGAGGVNWMQGKISRLSASTVIRAKGGNGGNGDTSAGGGGGGGGGFVCFRYRELYAGSTNPTSCVSAAGGTGGSSDTNAGANGATGVTLVQVI